MKKIVNFVFVFAFVFSIMSFTSANILQPTQVQVSVTPAEISFSVPEEINFGELTQGYVSEEIEFFVNNTGETNIRVEVSLDPEYSDTGIFRNLKFRKDGTVTTRTLSSFYLTIAKPKLMGEVVSQKAFVWLDLSKYTENLEQTMEDDTYLIFTAMPN